MKIPTPEFIKNNELNEHERLLVKCALAGMDCLLFDEKKAGACFDELLKAEGEKSEAERRDEQTLRYLAVRDQAAAENAPKVRAELIRFLARGGNGDYPVDPHGVGLMGAWITGTLALEGCCDLRMLDLHACHFVQAPIFRDAAGQGVNLSGSYVPGLFADRLTTAGSVFLRYGFEAAGTVRLLGAKIGGNLECDGGKFLGKNKDGNALYADWLITTGSVFLRHGFEAAGAVRLLGAKIGADLDCVGGKFMGQGTAFHLQGAKVTGAFIWRDLPERPKGLVYLGTAEVGTLVDDPKCWPEGRVMLDGFCYGRIAAGPTDYESRRDWLERQPETHLTIEFKPQPFEQLAKVLREMGHVEDAKRIAILKRRYQRRAVFQREWSGNFVSKLLGAAQRFASWLNDVLFGYGYLVDFQNRAFITILLFSSFGWFIFSDAYRHGAIVPNNPSLLKLEWAEATKGNFVRWDEKKDKVAVRTGTGCGKPYECFYRSVPDFQPFNPLVYSIDTFVPFVNLHQESNWIPQADGKDGASPFVRLYLWIHISVGWAVTALFAASLTGLVKKDV